MALDHYRTVGTSGLHVSALTLGAMAFGAPGGADERESRAILDRYFDAGGNFVDTSNVYARGESERILGRWFAADPLRRQKMVLGTKYSASATAGDPNSGGAGRKAIIAACEGSLRRLQTDHIDLYLMHWQDPLTPVEESMRALDDLVRAGKIRYAGFSDVPAWVVVQAQMSARTNGWSPLIALQIEYSLIERTIEHDYVPMAKAMGLGITPWSPLAGGALTGKYSRDGTVTGDSSRSDRVGKRLGARAHDIVDVLRGVGGKHGCTPGQVALAWLCCQPGVTSPIIGPRTIAQYEESVDALAITLDSDDMAAIDTVSRPSMSFPHNVMRRVWGTSHGGLTINGRYFRPSPATPLGPNSLD